MVCCKAPYYFECDHLASDIRRQMGCLVTGVIARNGTTGLTHYQNPPSDGWSSLFSFLQPVMALTAPSSSSHELEALYCSGREPAHFHKNLQALRSGFWACHPDRHVRVRTDRAAAG